MKGVGRCVIITGLSGAGKSTALKVLEDRGFYAVDNLPPALMPDLMRALSRNGPAVSVGVAIVIDLRGEGILEDLSSSIESIESAGVESNLIFLDASDDWLVRRYETTRRRHPMGEGITILEGIALERSKLGAIKAQSDAVLDTSSLFPDDLRSSLLSKLDLNEGSFTVIISSFGFKNGIPKDCDYMFDVRFLPNPNYVPTLKNLSGRDAAVKEYLEDLPEKRALMERLGSLMRFILAQYERTDKKQLHVAIGCTGGRHRSVAVAESLARRVSDMGYVAVMNHRDIELEGS
ncbi:MAG: RNase adapter RapZ [Synergistaceae bacterium]|jgi:UPF0042 nucleotide-binding protein|nr:RNase adapter RapZ [Synergistaceae bacterium]